MMTCFVAKSYGVKSTIARVRKREYSELAKSERQEQLGIDLIINPELLAAQELGKLVLHPEAHEVEYYADGQVVMLGLKLEDDSKILNCRLRDVHFPHPCVVVGVIRGEQMICAQWRHSKFCLRMKFFYFQTSRICFRWKSFLGGPQKGH